MAQAVYQLDSSGQAPQAPQGILRYPPAGPPRLAEGNDDSELELPEDNIDPYRMNNDFYINLKRDLETKYPLKVDREGSKEAPKEPETLDEKLKRAAEEVKETFKGQDNAQKRREAVDKVAQKYLEAFPDKSKVDISDFKAQLVAATSISPSRAASPSAFTLKSN
jgi:hypothetical protein